MSRPAAAVKSSADHDALQNEARPVELAQVLQEDHDLEALAVDRGEAEQREPEQHRGGPRFAGEEPAAVAVVLGDPAGPVDPVEEPVHHEQEHDQRRQAGRRLHVELSAVEAADQPHDAEPGRDAREQRRAAAERNGPAIDAVCAEEARRDRREHENRLEALPEHEDRAVEHDGGVAEAHPRAGAPSGRGCRPWRASRARPRPPPPSGRPPSRCRCWPAAAARVVGAATGSWGAGAAERPSGKSDCGGREVQTLAQLGMPN